MRFGAKILVLLLPAVEAAALGCQSADDDRAPTPDPIEDTVELAAETHVLPDELVSQAQVLPDALIFPATGNASLLGLGPGDVLVSGLGEGFLRKVASVELGGSASAGLGSSPQAVGDKTITIKTQNGSLVDAVKTLKLERSFSFSPPQVVLKDPGDKISGSLSLQRDFDLKLVIKNGSVEQFSLKQTSQTALSVDVKGAIDLWKPEKIRKTHLFFVGTFPVAVTVTFQPKLTLEGAVSFGLACPLQDWAEWIYLGGQGWYSHSGSLDGSCSLASAGKISGKLGLYGEARGELLLYGLLGPYASAKAGIETQVDPLVYQNDTWCISSVQELNVGFTSEVDPIAKALGTFEVKLASAVVPLSGPGCPGAATDAGGDAASGVTDAGLADATTDGGTDAPSDAGPSDGQAADGADAGCAGPLIACAGKCVDTQSHPKHCGACAIDCQGGACHQGSCQPAGAPVVLASGQSAPMGVAADGTHVYWTNLTGGEVQQCPAGGCTAPVTLAAGNSSPSFVAVDGVNVYFTNQGGTVNVVPACNGSGSCGPPSVLASGQGKPYGIAVGGGDVYWTNLGDGSVAKCATSGCGNLPTVLAVNQQGPRSIVTDGVNVYWTNRGTAINSYLDGRVRWCPLGVAPCPASQLFPGTLTYPNSIATDGTDVFITQRPVVAGGVPSGGFVLDCSVAGCSSPNALAAAPKEPEGIATDGQSVYWTEIGTQATGYKDGTIKRCPAGGGCSPVTIASAQTRPFAVALDQHYVYWTNTTAGTVMKAVK